MYRTRITNLLVTSVLLTRKPVEKIQLKDRTVAELFEAPLTQSKIEPQFKTHSDIPEHLREYSPKHQGEPLDARKRIVKEDN